MKKFAFGFGLLSLLCACGGAGNQDNTNIIQDIDRAIGEKIAPDWVIYEGSVPCIDCEAIHMELWLEQNEAPGSSLDYRLVVNYVNTPVGDTEEEINGKYTVISGHNQDMDAVLYQLNPGTDAPRYFVVNDDESITMLGENMQPLESEAEELDYRLELKETE